MASSATQGGTFSAAKESTTSIWASAKISNSRRESPSSSGLRRLTSSTTTSMVMILSPALLSDRRWGTTRIIQVMARFWLRAQVASCSLEARSYSDLRDTASPPGRKVRRFSFAQRKSKLESDELAKVKLPPIYLYALALIAVVAATHRAGAQTGNLEQQYADAQRALA